MTNWKPVNYIKTSDVGPYENHKWEFQITLPEPLANWDVFDYWEKERVHSMRDNLKQHDVLFDVGAEHGWMSVVFAKFCKVFLIEPTPEFWPNIYQTWKNNVIDQPVGCFCGLIGEKTNYQEENDHNPSFIWPKEIKGELIGDNKYLYINSAPKKTKIISIDDLVARSKIFPTALTIDIEGYEIFALRGAQKLLSENSIKVWVSIHPDLAEKIGSSKNEVMDYMLSLGYIANYLSTDHEEHWFFTK